MNVNEMTIGDAKEIAAMFGQKESPLTHPWDIGKNYFIRTVTHHFTGLLTHVFPQELVLQKAAWIADDGRLSESLENETFSEVEMFPGRNLIIGRASLIDAIEIKKLPQSTK